MGYKVVLTSAFNMSLGFVPVIVAILLCEWMVQDWAVYIATVVGLLYSFYSIRHSQMRVPNFILYISTAMLVLLSIAALIPGEYVPPHALPLTLEVSILIPMLILYLHKKRFINHYLNRKDSCSRRLFAQGAESAVVSARVVLILGLLHFIVISVCLAFFYPLDQTGLWTLYYLLPLCVFVLCVIINQIGIRYYNKLMSHTEFVPVVNIHGDVIGKGLAIEAVNYKSDSIYPVIRIAVSSKGMLFLCNRSSHNALDKNRVDLPMECFLRYGESLVQGAERIVHNTFPQATGLVPLYSINYHFENKQTNRLVYLFVLDLDDDSILCDPRFKGGKLWRFQQIEHNLDKNFFSECFEMEYEHLKMIIGIREKYKES